MCLGSDTSPLRLIESFRRENRLLKRKHKAPLPCHNKPVRGRQTAQTHTHTNIYNAHTHTHTAVKHKSDRLVCVCVCEKTSVSWHVENTQSIS